LPRREVDASTARRRSGCADDPARAEADILIPAAVDKVIHESNADRVKARIVAEAANGPTTTEADAMLHERGVFMIPDFLCNAGDVIVAYFETVQNRQSFYCEESEVHDRLDRKMTESLHDLLSVAEARSIDMRTAAYHYNVILC
jgi:glutamate dehydrogenase/leucine dehydrogenase